MSIGIHAQEKIREFIAGRQNGEVLLTRDILNMLGLPVKYHSLAYKQDVARLMTGLGYEYKAVRTGAIVAKTWRARTERAAT